MKLGLSILIIIQNLSAQVLTQIDQVGIAGFQHAGSISEIKPLSDGKHVLSSSRDNTVRLWEVTTGKQVRSFTHENFDDIWGISILPGEKEFLCASDFGKDGAVVRYEIATGKQLGIYSHSKTVYRVDVHPDGKRFAASDSANVIKLWDLTNDKMIREFTGHEGSVYSVIFNGDGSRLFSGCAKGKLKMWDTETGKCLKTHETEFDEIYTISASPDHKHIAVVSDDDHIRVLESKGLKLVWEKKMSGEGQVVTWSPDGELVATAGQDETLRIFNSRSGKVVQQISTERDHTPLTFSTDGTLLISGGENHLHLHSIDTGERFHPSLGVPALSGGFEGLAITNDGSSIYAHGGDDLLVRWLRDEEKTTEKTEQPNTITDLALSKDGSLLALSDNAGGVGIFSAESGKLNHRFKIGEPTTKITFGNQTHQLVIGGQQGALSLWNIEKQKRVGKFQGLSNEILDLEVSADGRTLVSAENDGQATFWNIGTLKKTSSHRAFFKNDNGEEQVEYPRTLALINNGRALLSGIRRTHLLSYIMEEAAKPIEMKRERVQELVAQLADAAFEKRKKASDELQAMGAPVLPILENMTHDDPEVRFRLRGIIHKMNGGGEKGDLTVAHAFNDTVYALDSDPQGRYFAATVGWSANANLVIGEVKEGKVKILQTLKTGRSPELVAFSPNGQFLVTGNRNGMVDVYEVGR